MIMTTSAQSMPWDDRGRFATRAGVVLTVAAAAYVFATLHSMVPLISVIASLATFFGPTRRSAVALRTIAAIVMLLFAWVSMASVGPFFIPRAFAMVIAIARTSVPEIA